MIKVVLIVLGFISLALGGIGIVLPGLPTTPFVLLAAGLFLRSSDKLYGKLKENKVFGPYLQRYMEQKGMTAREKITSLLLMWCMITISCIAIDSLRIRILLIALALVGTVVMGFIIKTVSLPEDDELLD